MLDSKQTLMKLVFGACERSWWEDLQGSPLAQGRGPPRTVEAQASIRGLTLLVLCPSLRKQGRSEVR